MLYVELDPFVRQVQQGERTQVFLVALVQGEDYGLDGVHQPLAVNLADGADAADAEKFMVNQGEGLVQVTHSLEAWKFSPENLRVGEVS